MFRVVGELNQKEGLAVLVVEQNAAIALAAAQRAYVLETGSIALSGTAAELKANDAVRTAYLGLLMQHSSRRSSRGSRDGSIYGSLALALVLIYKATEVINFAQGEMAMFTTYIAWALMEHHGLSVLVGVRRSRS